MGITRIVLTVRGGSRLAIFVILIHFSRFSVRRDREGAFRPAEREHEPIRRFRRVRRCRGQGWHSGAVLSGVLAAGRRSVSTGPQVPASPAAFALRVSQQHDRRECIMRILAMRHASRRDRSFRNQSPCLIAISHVRGRNGRHRHVEYQNRVLKPYAVCSSALNDARL